MQPRNKALFIDRDGTINVDCPYCYKPEELKIFDDAVRLMKEWQDKGYLIIIVTNQSGIGRKYFTVQQMDVFNNALLLKLRKSGVFVNAIYYCPHLPEDNCSCRKPKDGMVRQAVEDFNIDLNQCMIVGDRDDIEGVMARSLSIPYRIIVHQPL